ncbi:histidine phosphatase family protein [Paraglaciecola sp. MB-3u-78]|jgi:probable phosphoglycerate mutase|uniref:histidine phosphatase family protein n=1 Tax=Paraglaciecola sp. MB-3u-78 TaxID=2058332 RepID=UPI000C31C4D4|nr:histidine phosphatase family protein [Paraglaciecola sp. MB-3u-78]PKG99840.1 histidine phosphatase family protein [Paraglaciecola sp. MB-3u-78]
MSIYLIRHGQTNGNRDRIVQMPDTPLSDLGQQQAKQLAQTFRNIFIEKIICSDYIRTQQTAAPLRTIKKVTFSLQPLLRERSFGDLRGRPYEEIDADFFAESFAPPNGETHQQFIERVHLAWKFVLTTYQNMQGSLIVMTHGLVLRELIKQHLIVDDATLPLSDFQNTCITEVNGTDKKTVLRLCDAQHLLDKSSVSGAAV